MVDAALKRPLFNRVSAEQAEQADVVVCMRVGTGDETRFDDNEYGVCVDCGAAIYCRPYVPKKPPKVCVDCVIARVKIATEDERSR